MHSRTYGVFGWKYETAVEIRAAADQRTVGSCSTKRDRPRMDGTVTGIGGGEATAVTASTLQTHVARNVSNVLSPFRVLSVRNRRTGRR